MREVQLFTEIKRGEERLQDTCTYKQMYILQLRSKRAPLRNTFLGTVTD